MGLELWSLILGWLLAQGQVTVTPWNQCHLLFEKGRLHERCRIPFSHFHFVLEEILPEAPSWLGICLL